MARRSPIGVWAKKTTRVALLAGLAISLLSMEGCCEGASDGGGVADAGPARDGAGEGAAGLDDSPLGRTAALIQPALEDGYYREELEQVLSGWGRGARQPMTDLIRESYRRRGFRPVFIDGLWPSDAASVVVGAVREVPSHGLPASHYRPKALLPLFGALALDPEAGDGTLTAQVGDGERLADLEWQLPRSVYKTPRKSEKVPEVVQRRLKHLPDVPPTPPEVRCALRAAVDLARGKGAEARRELEACGADDGARESALLAGKVVIEGRREHRRSLALLDAMLVQAFYQWVIDFSIDVRIHPFLSLGPANRSRLPTKHRETLLGELSDEGDAEAFRERMLSHVPRDPGYDKARVALARYVELLDSKRPARVRVKGRLAKGSAGDAVEALQERLAAEGYYDGPASGVFDDATHEAVVRYQRTHQLADAGIVGEDTAESLETPFEWRVKQILAALGRYRESPIHRQGPPGLYVMVNLPSFELQVVEGGQTIRRHKVIVGSNKRVPDPTNDGVVWHQRRTKIFDTKITEVVLNPTWIVPQAIRIDEIEPKVLESPGYLAENNFKTVGDLLVQGPAETNPLGEVKLTLESTDSIYLHDTDKRWLFNEHARELSHGCIRVEGIVDLAKHILGRQGVEPDRIDRRIEEGTTLGIKVDSPIPIFVEYRTLGFDQDDEPVFFRDIYEFDVAYWKKRTPITRPFP